MRTSIGTLILVSAFASPTMAQLMIPDSGVGDRVMLFNDFDGSLIDANWITDAGAVGWAFTTPKEALLVNNEIWVSDQVTDAIHRFDSNRNFLGSITAHPNGGNLDNLRGMGFDGQKVYLTVFPSTTANRGVAIFDTAGNPSGFWPAAVNTHSLFDVAPFQGDFLIANSTTNSVDRWNSNGTPIGQFATGITFVQQTEVLSDNSVIAVSTIAAAGIEGVYHFNADGSLRLFIDTENLKQLVGEQVPRAAWLLGDGNYLITTSIGVFKYDVMGNSYSTMLAGVDAQFIGLIPEPASLLLLALGALALRRR